MCFFGGVEVARRVSFVPDRFLFHLTLTKLLIFLVLLVLARRRVVLDVAGGGVDSLGSGRWFAVVVGSETQVTGVTAFLLCGGFAWLVLVLAMLGGKYLWAAFENFNYVLVLVIATCDW